MSSSSSAVLRFVPFASAPKLGFWQEVGRRKLEEWGLDERPKKVVGQWGVGCVAGLPPRLELTRSAFSDVVEEGAFAARGTVVTVNTLEELKRADKGALLGGCEDFVAIVFADMKKNRYVYWFGFRGEVLDPPARRVASGKLSEIVDAVPKVEFCAARVENGKIASTTEKLEDATEGALFCIADPATGEDPGWPARNYVAAIARRFKRFRLALWREGGVGGIWIDVEIPEQKRKAPPTGWEPNAHGRMGPRAVDLAPLTDPNELAAAARSLNLHLMRWRLLPDLDVAALARTKCLLLGAGTLGCNVARCLAGWGVRHLTFVDNGTVSYSNPARQPLYTVADCSKRALKATAAAAAMDQIAPGTAAEPTHYEGHVLTIPMPGHALHDDAETDFDVLRRLVSEHDAIFVLTDTREARWLPTVLGTAAPNKPTILNVALGLDTYVVLRHGAGSSLGCYFCNDVSAPGNSTINRTLDQQCTVSRPGLAPLASALAVELLVALLHHPLRHAAPPDKAGDLSRPPDHPLGILPHSIRGFLTHFSSVLPATRAFPNCTACSDPILDRFRQHDQSAFDFLAKVANDPALLEQTAGLADLATDIDPDTFLLEDDDDDDDDDDPSSL
ncbi:hypothetical protein CTAYLR_000034 [Chrysophaeum taylorii]|uniref:Ubiquitin-like modifier-activating enzyme ATG7 n=1 Tax=Chrysophaeum taylorii TaxID=2483200 RepID=A0AAD7UIZ4_9STRA|nr:hypothetical protein CTAYLR_000034 [Chrysophaeum taylorii]